MSILVVGSVAIDSVKTPFGKKDSSLGGSATYFSFAASFFNRVDIIATVGRDFPARYISLFRRMGVGTDGLKIAEGRTFRWKGSYDYDLNTAHTIFTHLNVFRDFKPQIPANLKESPYIFLANIDPLLQYDVLRQAVRPRLVACDSMNYWITHKRRDFEKLLKKVDVMLLNDSEARQFTGESNLMKASRIMIAKGPKAVIVKKGEHGAVYFSKNSHFVAPAYPIESVYDPTGAGDTFAGGLIGFLSRQHSIDETGIRKAIIYGSIMASFVVEDFSVNRLLEISMKDIRSRYEHYRKITRF